MFRSAVFTLLCCVLPSAAFSATAFDIQTVVKESYVIWGFDFLPDQRIIFSQRSGQLMIYDPKVQKSQIVNGVPAVYHHGQGGLLDVRVAPDFAKSKAIYFTFSQPRENGATTAFAKATLDGTKLENVKILFSAEPANGNDIHFGSRIVFDGEDHAFISVGDRNDRHQAQNPKAHLGKIIRVALQGDTKAEVWSIGQRNPQGLDWHPKTGDLWEAEMGPRGGDEINIIRKGKNYGWPVVTYGREYWGPKIGEGTHKAGMEQPVTYWVPSISPSAIHFYTGKRFPEWSNNLFVACLSGQHIRRLVIEGAKIVQQEALLADQGWRFWNIRTSPDGLLYFSTDDGRIGRLVPRKE